jgi:F0F1-type ATP synthase delta subunit
MTQTKEQPFLDQLTKDVSTKEDLVFFLEEISLIEKLIFKKINLNLSEKVKPIVSENFFKKIQELEEKNLINKNPETIQNFFNNLKKSLLAIDQIKIIISFKPKQTFINKIKSWLEKELRQNLIIDFVHNPEIVAGAIIEFQGKQFDCSLIQKIKQLNLN